MNDRRGVSRNLTCSDDIQSLLQAREMEDTLRKELERLLAEGWFSDDGYRMLRETYEFSRTEVLVFLVKYSGLVRHVCTDISINLIGEKLGMKGNTVRTHITRILNKINQAGCKDVSQIRKWAVEKQILHDENYPLLSQQV